MNEKPKILVTGAAGFIGFHLCRRLLEDDQYQIYGLDNLNDYYDVDLKNSRLKILKEYPGFSFYREDLADKDAIGEIFRKDNYDYVMNLAAQAGVRYSLENPFAYTESNVTGFLSILEACRYQNVKHLVFASTSSVYGLNTDMPFSEDHPVDHPISLYSASKRANELMAHTYAHLYNLPSTGLRFFTVYGPWGRPDMALFKFTRAILNDESIDVYNRGEMIRDFTYVEDIIEGIIRLLNKVPLEKPGSDLSAPSKSTAPFRIFNIGSNNPIQLMEFIREIESALGKKAKLNLMPMQAGDVKATYADVGHLMDAVDYKPSTSIKEGIGQFIEWYKEYYKIKEQA